MSQYHCIACGDDLESNGALSFAERIDLSGNHFQVVRAKQEFGIKEKVVLICHTCKLRAMGVVPVPKDIGPVHGPLMDADISTDESFLK